MGVRRSRVAADPSRGTGATIRSPGLSSTATPWAHCFNSRSIARALSGRSSTFFFKQRENQILEVRWNRVRHQLRRRRRYGVEMMAESFRDVGASKTCSPVSRK